VTPRARVTFGLVVLAIWGLMLADKVRHAALPEALWCCNVGQLLLGLVLLARAPRLAATGTFWLFYGLPLWIIYLFGGEVWLSSLLTHLVSLPLGVLTARALGVPRGTWWRATVALALLQALTRFVTPPALNVNLAHAIHPGWEPLFLHSYALYYVVMLAFGAGACLLGELALRRGAPC
jgi:hypothetical protein